MNERLIEEVIAGLEEKAYAFACTLVPHLTREDFLQPNDYPELEHHPYFRYLEGMVHGAKSLQMALRVDNKMHVE